MTETDKVDLVNKLMSTRKDWTIQDFKDAYEDEWDEIPSTLKECHEKMEEYINNTYEYSYIQECIDNES
jgi:hypothetical protein